MTELLKKAFETASKLPNPEQNILAKWILDEIKTEKKWEQTLADSEDVLDQLADEALKEDKKRKTRPLDTDEL